MRKLPFYLLAATLLLSPLTLPASVPMATPSESPVRFDPELAKAAFNALKNMRPKERKNRLKLAKKEIKNFRTARKNGEDPSTNTLLLVLLDLLLPPLAVYLHEGETNNRFWITLLLFVLGLAGVFFFSWLLIFAAVVYGLIVILGG